jgi:hypothetical protein
VSTPTASSRHAAAKTAAHKGPLSKAAYEKRMQLLGRTLSRELYTIGLQADGTPAQDAVTLEMAIPKLRAAARELGDIDPPKPVREEHEYLRKAVLEFANQLKGPIARLKSGDLDGLGDIYALPGARDMETASADIEKMGYKIVGAGKAANR